MILDFRCTMLYNTPMIPFAFHLEPGVPVYEQIIYAVKRAIVSGQLRAGDRFPSVRTLSRELKINPNTAQKAVSKLVQEKILEMHPGIGSVVAAGGDADRERREQLLGKDLERIVVEARQLGVTRQELNRAVKEHWESFGSGKQKRGKGKVGKGDE